MLTASGYLGGFFILFNWASHFKLQYTICLLILLPFLFLKRCIRTATCALIFLCLSLYEIAPLYLSPGNSNATSHNLRVLLANLYCNNPQRQALLDMIRNESPDVIAFQEYTQKWHNDLAPILKRYPYHIKFLRDDPFGIALYSRFSLQQPEVMYWGQSQTPSITADVTINGQTLQLITTHPLPPISSKCFNLRNQQLQSISQYIQESPKPIVLLGDLNCTPFSPTYKKFTQVNNLKGTREGVGFINTWPLPRSSLIKKIARFFLQVPIDHILTDQKIQTINCRSGPAIGSDHRPLIADLHVPTLVSRARDIESESTLLRTYDTGVNSNH